MNEIRCSDCSAIVEREFITFDPKYGADTYYCPICGNHDYVDYGKSQDPRPKPRRRVGERHKRANR